MKKSTKQTVKDMGPISLTNENYSKIFEELTNFMGVNYSVIDTEGNYLIRNETYLKEFPSLTAETGGSLWNDCKKAMEKCERITKEEICNEKYYYSIKQPIVKNNKCIGIMVLSFDITAQKENEIVKQKFINSINHDIKTPFMGISTLSEHMASHEKDPHKKSKLMLINASAIRLCDHLNKVLEVVSNKDNKHSKASIFNLKETIDRIADMVKPVLIQKNLTLEIDCPDIYVKFNEMHIEQICLNLLSNAIKFTKKGKINVVAKLEETSLSVSIIDTGIGIDKEHQEIIFEEFERVVPTYLEPEYRGCGLGLSIAKNLVTRMQGSISVISALNKGSTFNVSIPLQ